MSPHPRDGEGPGRGIGGGPDPEKGDGPDPETESGRDPGNGDDGRGRLLTVGATGPWSGGTEKGGTATVSVSVNVETGTLEGVKTKVTTAHVLSKIYQSKDKAKTACD